MRFGPSGKFPDVRCSAQPGAAFWDELARKVLGQLRLVTTVITVEAKGNHAESVYLEKLAEELTHRGLEAWLMAPPGRVPSVYVVNPAARALEDNVYVNQGKDGLWWFWWSWAERISIADDLDAAASAITRVLALPRVRD
jgi:hypothetical protein